MAAPGKQYGLILPRKASTKSAVLQRPSVFDDDSDEEISVGESLQKESVKKKMMKQVIRGGIEEEREKMQFSVKMEQSVNIAVL
ncbi:hypothetical protein SKAU_G00092640 [Synaphobranchus kaupii]|uniref:Uncharacterized protein n=1 Tax=Synaphobranchus kaupii TaxID=118154 RepID=A0A9Q1FX08_SYNKA|nr:hypothetical protein SKAU_G00092640 [Synaphobranchus kaupii]